MQCSFNSYFCKQGSFNVIYTLLSCGHGITHHAEANKGDFVRGGGFIGFGLNAGHGVDRPKVEDGEGEITK